MNDFNVATVPTFSDFFTEALADNKSRVVRLVLSESTHSTPVLPVTEVTLDLQGFNTEGSDLVWLSRSVKIRGHQHNGKYPEPKLQALYEAMSDLHDIVREHLESLDCKVLPGRYVLPSDLQPINGRFDCVRWDENEEGLLIVRRKEEIT
jgi:hypothetical protein